MIPTFQTVECINYIECGLNTIKDNKNSVNNLNYILTLIGLSLKYHDPNKIYKIIRNNFRKLDDDSYEEIVTKYNLDPNKQLDKTHPEYEKIRNEVITVSLHDMDQMSQTGNDNSNHIPFLIGIKFTDIEINEINRTYQSTNNPLVFIRQLENNNTAIVFFAFDNQKKYIYDISFSLTFNVSEDCEKKDKLIKLLNDSIDEISNLEIKDNNNLVSYTDDDDDYSQTNWCTIV